MSLFGWLKGKNNKVEIIPDRIWLTSEAKFAGIRAEAAQAVSDSNGVLAVIVVAYFNDCLKQLQAAVAGFDPNRICVARADALANQTPTTRADDASGDILLIVGERHPLPSHNEHVLNFANNQPYRCRISYHASLEDALLKPFAGEWVQGVLRGLGMNENEALESRIVVRRIQKSLEKIETLATGDLPANSVEEWLERNCPQLS